MVQLILPNDGPQEVDGSRWQKLVTGWQQEAGKDFSDDIVVNFVTAQEMKTLNHQHTGKPEPTDVLSFVYDPPLEDDSRVRIGGEIIICPEVAHEFVERHGLQLADEYATLLVHGLLHLAGWDHASEEDRRRYESATRAIIEAGGYQTVSLWLD